jgi:hypothetical protein
MSATQVGSSNCDLQADGAKAPQVEFVRRFVIDQFERKVERLFSRRVTSLYSVGAGLSKPCADHARQAGRNRLKSGAAG